MQKIMLALTSVIEEAVRKKRRGVIPFAEVLKLSREVGNGHD